jgi:hypothetical protein
MRPSHGARSATASARDDAGRSIGAQLDQSRFACAVAADDVCAVGGGQRRDRRRLAVGRERANNEGGWSAVVVSSHSVVDPRDPRELYFGEEVRFTLYRFIVLSFAFLKPERRSP